MCVLPALFAAGAAPWLVPADHVTNYWIPIVAMVHVSEVSSHPEGERVICTKHHGNRGAEGAVLILG